jgi:hypothetical protein
LTTEWFAAGVGVGSSGRLLGREERVLRSTRSHKAKKELVIIARSDEYHVVAGVKVLLASIGRGQTHVDTLVDATKNTMCDDIFHIQHYTLFGCV